MKGTIDGLSEVLQAYIEAAPSIRKAVDDLIGTDVISAMTIHKS